MGKEMSVMTLRLLAWGTGRVMKLSCTPLEKIEGAGGNGEDMREHPP